jgi:hypothetical protein
MPRLQKVTEKVFAEIAETPQKKGAYTTFLEVDKILGLPEEDELLQEMKGIYEEIVTEKKKLISELSAIEEIIIQIRCKRVVNEEIRLSLSRNYIYARSIFYRRGHQINDIRVVVGTTNEYGDDLNALMKDKVFLSKGVAKLLTAMQEEINKNVEQLKVIIDERVESN